MTGGYNSPESKNTERTIPEFNIPDSNIPERNIPERKSPDRNIPQVHTAIYQKSSSDTNTK